MNLDLDLQGERLTLMPERALFWHRTRSLIAADLHLGKAGHFRTRGIPVPKGSQERTLNRLDHLIEIYDPEQVILLGDLFHSGWNREWEEVGEWLQSHQRKFTLVLGNHEILPERIYAEMGLECHYRLKNSPFVFEHMPPSHNRGPDDEQLMESNGAAINSDSDRIVICGHVHPCVRIAMQGRQNYRLACFHLSGNVLTLPAFGEFTGGYRIRPRSGDTVYAIAEDTLFQIPT